MRAYVRAGVWAGGRGVGWDDHVTDRCLDPTTHAFVLQDMGTHAQLMQSSEVYRNLVKRQIVGAVPGGEDERRAGAGAS